MAQILVGIDGSERGEHALEWAVFESARLNATSITLLTVVDEKSMRAASVSLESARSAASDALSKLRERVVAHHPELTLYKRVEQGEVVSVLADIATQYDLIVLGSHHGSNIGETISGAKGLRVSISTTVPTVVVPIDWSEEHAGAGIVVGVAQDDSSDSAIEFGARAAVARGASLELVSAYGVPPFLSKPAEVMGGGMHAVGEGFQARLDALVKLLKDEHETLDVTGKAVEGPSPTHVLDECARGHELLILGTHSRSALGRAVFGSVSHSVLMNLAVPTMIVPQI